MKKITKCVYNSNKNFFICSDDDKNVLYEKNRKGFFDFDIGNFQRSSTSKLLIYWIIFAFLSHALLITVHEVGHAIVLTMYGIDIEVVVTFPGILFMDSDSGGFVQPEYGWSSMLSDREILMVYIAGSLSEILFSVVLLYMVIQFELNPKIEYFIFTCFFVSIFSVWSYFVSDLYLTDFEGDWYTSVNLYPQVEPMMWILLFFISLYFVYVYKKHVFKSVSF